jgi:predicted ATPase/class 3 adenylate cyclase/Tfp pilus assembly protein PilF
MTFLFTDIENSTPLWDRHEATMHAVIARHDLLLDEIISRHQGRRVKERGEGDSFFAIFLDPTAAVTAALAINQAVLAEPWPPETPIRVRFGLHTGTAEFREGDYYGPVVNRCARIRGLGHGGQVLLSSTTAALVQGTLTAEACLRSLGLYALKGLADPEEVFQLCHPLLPDAFPPLLSPQAPRHNLPSHWGDLIARDTEQAEILALLGTGRLVTLTGSGGIGKTRLALTVAAELVDRYPDGVWLVELAALADAGLLHQAVASALGLHEEPGRSFLDSLIDHLLNRRLLLVLDNCEHLIAACAGLESTLLRTCPHLHILTTSREGLDVAGEQRYRVPSLPVPQLTHGQPPERLANTGAVALFLERARARRADFALTAQNAHAVAQICVRLDGIPLAIELAAARIGSLPVEAIAGRLDDRFRLLTGGARDALPRQRTLRAALDWSYDLLGEPERVLLDRLSLFTGGWTLAAAEAVCAGNGDENARPGGPQDLPQVDTWEVVDLLDSLVNKSLVQVAEADGDLRYGLLETVRQYGQERLDAAGHVALLRDRHLAWCLTLAEEAAPHLTGPEQGHWLARLDHEHDNLRVALAWARTHDAGEVGLRLACALVRFWFTRGYFCEGRGWLAWALSCPGAAPAGLRATALKGGGNLALHQGEYGQAAVFYEEALSLFRVLDDKQGIAGTLTNLGIVMYRQDDCERATVLFEEAVTLARVHGDTLQIARTLGNLASVYGRQGDSAREASLYEEALALFRAAGDRQGVAAALDNLGLVAARQGEYARAAALHEESLTIARELGDRHAVVVSLVNLGSMAQRQHDYRRSETLLREALLLGREIDARDEVAASLETLAWIAAVQGSVRLAAQLAGAAEALREELGVPLGWEDSGDHDRAVQAMRAALGEKEFAAAWAEGRSMPLDQALNLASPESPAIV